MDISNKAVVEFIAKTDQFRAEVGNLKSTLESIQKPATDSLTRVQQTASNVGKSMTKYITAPLVGVGALATREFSSYESALNGVGKTMNISGKELDDMGKKFQVMARTVPVATNELLEIGAVGAQLGVGAKDIEGFTKTIADMGLATDMSSEQAAVAMAQFMASMGKTSATTDNYNEVVSRLGSTIVALGNNFSTGETAILEMGKRLVGTAHSVGMTEIGVMALSTAMSSLGITAQEGGGAMSRVMRKINTSVLSNSKSVVKFAEVSGMSAQEFANAWKEDPIKAIEAFIGGLKDVQKSGGDMASLLADLGIKGSQEVDVLSRLAGGHETLSSAIEMANGAWNENSALSEEAKTRYGELKGSIEKFKNALSELGATFGELVGGQFKTFLDGLTDLINKFNDLDESSKKIILIFAEVVAAVGPVLLIVSKLIGVFKEVKGAILAIKGAFTAFSAVLSGPVGMIAMIIGSLILLGIVLYKHRDQIIEFAKTVATKVGELKDKIVEIIENIIVAIVEKFNSIVEFLTTLWETIKTGATEAWTAIGEALNEVIQEIITFISDLWDSLTEILSTVWETIKSIAQTVWDGIKNIISSLVESVVTTVKDLWGQAKAFVSQLWDSLKSKATSIFSGIVSVVSNLSNEAKTAISNAWEKAKATVTNLINNIKTTVANGFSKVVSTVMSKGGEIVSEVKNAFNRAVSAARNFVSSAVSAGRDLIVGFVNGVREKAGALIGAVQDAIGSAIGAAKRLLGIGSPSKLFKKFAKWTMQGYEIGVKAKEGAPVKAMTKATNNIIDAFSPVSELALPSFMNSSFNTKITHQMALGTSQPKPMNLNLVLGKRAYYNQVEDISGIQDRNIELKERYGFNV